MLGAVYEFRVFAENAMGRSAASPPSRMMHITPCLEAEVQEDTPSPEDSL